MDIMENSLPVSINHNNFPAKLWRLVNNPANEAICWDSFGEVIVIDQLLFEKQILSPGSAAAALDNADGFKTTNFSSFVRQLNLYGFKKADPAVKGSHPPAGDSGARHHFHNPNFKRSRPELVASLRRLTVDNRAKLQAGLSVNCRPPSRIQRYSGEEDDGRDKNGKRGRSSPLSPTHQESTHPHYPNKGQTLTVHNGTPVPPRYLIRGHGAALSPTVFGPDKRIPVSLSHHYASSSNAVHIQQGLLASANYGNPNVTSFNPPNAQYQPNYYSPVCQCYHPSLVASHMTGSGLFSPHGYYQASYPVNMAGRGDYNQDFESKENQEEKKCDINLDKIFQIADEVMQTPPNSYLVRVATPEKPSPVLVPSYNTTLCDTPASPTNAYPVCVGPIIVDVLGSPDLVTYEEQDKSVVSVPEQMPEDAIFEVTSEDEKDTVVIGVEVSDTQEYQSGLPQQLHRTQT